MASRVDVNLERKPGCIGSDGDEVRGRLDDAVLGGELFPEDVAEQTASGGRAVRLGALQLLVHEAWDDGQADDLGVAMFLGGAGDGSPVLEDLDDVYLIVKTKHTSDAALNSKKISVQVSMLQ